MIRKVEYLTEEAVTDFLINSGVFVMKINIKIYLVAFFICINAFVLMSCALLKPEEPSLASRMAEIRESAFEGKINKQGRRIFKIESLVHKSLFDKLQDLITESDTVILFSTYDIQTAVFEGTLWTPQKSLNFKRQPGLPIDMLDITEGKPLYSDFIITNVLKRNWDAIQSRQKEQGITLGGTAVDVFFLHKENEEFKIDYFTFQSFFDAYPILN